MHIVLQLEQLLTNRKMTLQELSNRVDLTTVNLSAYKTGKAKAIRFSTLTALCEALHCQPGDLLVCVPDEDEETVRGVSTAARDPSGPPVLDFDIGDAVKQLRSETGLSQEEFAKECGVKTSIIDRLESGDPNMPLQALNQVAERLGKHMEFRLGVRFV